MKLSGLNTGVPVSAAFWAGCFYFCLLFLVGSSLLLWKWSLINYFKEPSPILGVYIEQQLGFLPEGQVDDDRITILQQFLIKHNSPLATQAAEMIKAADEYKFDWRLLPAIAGKESSFGKKMPWDKQNDQSSHNAWGWGVYGNKAPIFSSWQEAIKTVGEGLRYEYYNQGYVRLEMIMKKFTPRSDGSWTRDVKAIMEQIGS